MVNNTSIVLADAITSYLHLVTNSRSSQTERTYAQALAHFAAVLQTHLIMVESATLTQLTPDWFKWYLQNLRVYAVATEQLYLTALVGFYEFCAAEYNLPLNLAQIKAFVRRRQRRLAPRVPPFPREQIESLLANVGQSILDVDDPREPIRNLRDRAFFLTLADTGLRISEVCGLRRGQFIWKENRAIVIIKGGRESVVRFSERAIEAIQTYLQARAVFVENYRAIDQQPIFARHDTGAGKQLSALSAVGGRNIVNDWVCRILGSDAKGTITPHSFRHYFVTVVLRATGNIRLAQELARHKNISITQRYAHLSDSDLDQTYQHIFDH